MMATAFLAIGFVLVVVGVAAYDWRLALVLAGAVMFLAGGLEFRSRSTPK
jgi:hypothetical protein